MEVGLPVSAHYISDTTVKKWIVPDSEVAIVGGGLAGLSLAILLAKDGIRVVVFEKGTYPRHKVCGEYISMESYGFLKRLGMRLEQMNLPQIRRFKLTSAFGTVASCDLDPGGIGISRFTLDDALATLAAHAGVVLISETAVRSIVFNPSIGQYTLTTAEGDTMHCRMAVGAYGRLSGMGQGTVRTGPTFIGVKYHLSAGPPPDLMEMHHFKGGYCGVSLIEGGRACMCYLADAAQLKPYKGDLDAFEADILGANPYLRPYLDVPRLMPGARTSGLHFGVSEPRLTDYPLLGDAAGFIPPITGNGMSLAFRSAHALHPVVVAFVRGRANRAQVLKTARRYTNKYLRVRIQKGIQLQNLLLGPNQWVQKGIFLGLKHLPGLMRILSKRAVGDPF